MNSSSCDSDGNNSEAPGDMPSMGDVRPENGDIHIDSNRMTDDYKIITKLREQVCLSYFCWVTQA